MALVLKEIYYAFYHPTPSSHLKVWDGGSRNGIPLQYSTPQAVLDAITSGGHRLDGVRLLKEVEWTLTATPENPVTLGSKA